MAGTRPHLSLWQILNMNLGFFGIQFSFGRQQSNMSPIHKYLGADEASLPLLWLAGPVSGPIVQPLIGAIKTWDRANQQAVNYSLGHTAYSLGRSSKVELKYPF